ncbi:hypothetical protein [Roseivirga thermotolerans]|uniref:Uncharacterized protein n=1 Tax=Roseivirga thermotolerans TaxID=1758176 RepID=A0ABQ3I3J5_9BACT|nr:hypothetical protein [Roseivirga thermotolerans]GHE51292.1 hypothetical protein GCM10011340_01790 [Roseivirga thermotolerans]
MKKESSFKKFRYFLAELLILIIGITASFALNEFRVNKQEQRQQKDLLKSFKANLVVDSTILHQGIKQLEGQLKNAQKLLVNTPAEYSDSTVVWVVSLLNYVPFSSNDITYQEMKSVGSTRIIGNDSLTAKIIGLYENGFELVNTWTDIDSEHVRLKMISYVEEQFPFVLGFQYGRAAASTQREFLRAVQADKFKHLIQFGASYKASTKYSFEQVLEDIRETLALIDEELAISQKSSDPESTSRGL